MSRSRARKNRNKFREIRTKHLNKVMGVNRENLVINAPVAFASSVEKSVSEAIKNLRNIERVRFRGPAISKLPETKTDEIAPCPWLSKLDLAGVWSDPVEVTHVQGHSFEEVKFSSMVNLAKALKRSNSLEYIKKTAEVLGEDIKIDDIFLGESIGMIRRRSDTWEMDEVKKDSHEWAIVMVAFCRYPELAEQLKTEGHTLTEVQRSTIDENNMYLGFFAARGAKITVDTSSVVLRLFPISST